MNKDKPEEKLPEPPKGIKFTVRSGETGAFESDTPETATETKKEEVANAIEN